MSNEKKEIHKHYHLLPNRISDNCLLLGVVMAVSIMFVAPTVAAMIASIFSN
jgi:hypothetical protein